MNFRLIDNNKILEKYVRQVLITSPYRDLGVKDNRRPYLSRPVLMYVCIDLVKTYSSMRGHGPRNTPMGCYHTLPVRYAKKLVYFRTEKTTPIDLRGQLIDKADMFETFIQSLNELVSLKRMSKELKPIREIAYQTFERNISEVKKEYSNQGILLLSTISRTFEHVDDDGNSLFYTIPYVLFLDHETALEYVYQRKNKLRGKPKPIKTIGTFQDHVHTILDLNLPGNSKVAKRKAQLKQRYRFQ